MEADLLLHVVDAASPAAGAQRAAVLAVLRELGVPEAGLRARLIEVLNKADLPAGGGLGPLPEPARAAAAPARPAAGGSRADQAARTGLAAERAPADELPGGPRSEAAGGAAGRPRPGAEVTVVRTSVVTRAGLAQLLEAVDEKARPALAAQGSKPCACMRARGVPARVAGAHVATGYACCGLALILAPSSTGS